MTQKLFMVYETGEMFEITKITPSNSFAGFDIVVKGEIYFARTSEFISMLFGREKTRIITQEDDE